MEYFGEKKIPRKESSSRTHLGDGIGNEIGEGERRLGGEIRRDRKC